MRTGLDGNGVCAETECAWSVIRIRAIRTRATLGEEVRRDFCFAKVLTVLPTPSNPARLDSRSWRSLHGCFVRIGLLDPVEHLSGGLCGLRAGDAVDADHEKKLWLIGGGEDYGESVAGAASCVSAGCGASFYENRRVRKSAGDF